MRRSRLLLGLVLTIALAAGVGQLPPASSGVAGVTGAASASAVAPSSGVAQRGGYRVRPGMSFSLPGSGTTERTLVRHIDNTPEGAYIRVAQWSFSSTTLANALVRAHDRGVVVRVILPRRSKEWRFRAVEILIDELGTSTSRPSFIKILRHSARGPDRFDGVGTTMHQKSWQFSTTGESKRVTVISSGNATDNARTEQSIDSYTWVGASGVSSWVYETMANVFVSQVRDRAVRRPYLSRSRGDWSLFFSPWNSPGMADPVVRRINRLPATGDLTIRTAIAAWHGTRGNRIASALAAKVRQVRANGHRAGLFVLAGAPTHASVRRILAGAGAQICNGKRGKVYLHSKFMTAKYRGPSGPAFAVWAGSENWGGDAQGADELTFRAPGRAAYSGYVRYFNAATDRFSPSCGYR